MLSVHIVTVSLDLNQTDETLRQEWKQVLRDDEHDYLDDASLRQQIRETLRDERYGVMTFKYIILSNILTKAVHPEAHYRAMQTESKLIESFSSRTVAEQVVVDWEQENGQRLGGSNEPGTSKPFRWPEVSEEMQVMRDDVRDRLYELLEELEQRTDRGEIDPVDVLRYTLYEISQLETQTVDYASPSAVPYRELEPYLFEYLQTSGGGERLAAVAAGIVKAAYFHAGDGEWEVNAEHVNIPDEQSDAAGDIEVFEHGELNHAYEVKDKPVAKNDIVHAVEKAQTNELGEYLYLVGAGFKNGEQESATRAAAEAPIEMILVDPSEMIVRLKFTGKEGRTKFIDYVGELLNEMRATEQNKRDWKIIAEGFD